MNYEIWGVLIAIIVAIISYLKVKEDKTRFAAIITLLLINATLLISLRYKLFPAIESKGIISQELIKDDQTLEFANNIISANKAINNVENPAFLNLYSSQKADIKQYFSSIKNGVFIVSKDEISDFSTELIKNAKKEIIATSYISKDKWWDTDWGKQYEEINYSLVKNGVCIERFFIFSNQNEYLISKDFIKKQKDKGIKVHYLFVDQIGGDYNQDVILIDDRIGGKLILNPDKGMTKAEMIIFEEGLHEIRKIINKLKISAKN